MIRLLILLPGNQLFGQEQSLLTLAGSLRECGVQTHFLVHSNWGHKIVGKLDRLCFPWAMLPLGSLWSLRLSLRNPVMPARNVLAVVRSSMSVLRIIKSTMFTHLLVGNVTFASYLLPALCVSRIRVVWRHGDDVPHHSLFHRYIGERLFRRANVHVVNCRYLEQQLRKRYPFLDPLVIYNAPRELGWECSGAVRTSSVVNPKHKRIIFIGQLSPHKGILVLLEAFRVLAVQHPSLALDLVGDLAGVGECKPAGIANNVRSAVTEFQGRIVHHGIVDDPTGVLSASHIHVCPSIWQEPSPNVVIEAKQNHLPSVVFNVGGIAELVTHQVDGYVCRECSSEALVAGINYFLADEERRKEAGNAAFRSIADRFSRERFQRQWIEVLQRDCPEAESIA